MKNTFKWFVIIALVAVIGFSMSACSGDDSSGSGGGGGGSGGAATYPDEIADEDKPTEFTAGNQKAIISNGKVDLVLVEVSPRYDVLEYFYGKDGIKENFAGVTVTPSDTKMAIFSFSAKGLTSGKYYFLNYIKKDYSAAVQLCYVDKDVTIKGTGFPEYMHPNVLNFDVSLKKGWNYLVVPAAKNGVRDYKTAYTNLPGGYTWTVMDEKMRDEYGDAMASH